jgi:hypothetical protein
VALILDIDLKLREQPFVAHEVLILRPAPSVTECESSEAYGADGQGIRVISKFGLVSEQIPGCQGVQIRIGK